ncbi:MAG: 3-deoxy-manno-octulosonate cytidylyltransferase [Cytophagales bacterium]|nr:3-deoxy-manno-octulosonate cytidylyltransferase [Cytophagales bacterium]
MIIGIIPARYASTRFPGKPLADIAGKSMIQRVYEKAIQCDLLDQVIIATDHEAIQEAALQFTENVVMTSTEHKNGTERCAEVAANTTGDYFLNIQGDEPFIDPLQIKLVCESLLAGAKIASLKIKIEDWQDIQDPNLVKVVTDHNGKALYFSRSPIPYCKTRSKEQWPVEQTYYKHVGLYGFQKATLEAVVKLPQAGLEVAESLEQLRWLAHGYSIQVQETTIDSTGIDVPADIDRALRIFQP